MELQHLCTYCMAGSTEQYLCPVCKNPADWDKKRPATALPARHILGQQYYIGRVIGCGGYGITYLAWDMKVGRRVAVKEFYPTQDVTREQNGVSVRVVFGQEDYVAHVKKRFLEEAQSIYAFSAEADIVNVYRLFEENGTAYYSMEFLDGMDLKSTLLKYGKMPWEKLSVYMKMVMRALQAIHEKNLIHRDISPDNIFLTRDGHAKLIDFGSLRSYNNPNGLTTILKHNFAPYEQYRSNGNQGPWTDIYALCVTMYYALSGVLPPKAPDRIMSDQTIPLEQLCPTLPANVAQAIKKGMSVMPEERYQTVAELSRQIFGTTGYICLVFQGMLNGKRWYIKPGESYVIGRDFSCNIQYPPNAAGISRRQCMVYVDGNGKVYVKDENSTYGTYLNGQRLQPPMWYEWQAGSVVNFGQETVTIVFG